MTQSTTSNEARATTIANLATAGWELAPRTAIRAFRANQYLLIVAQGDLPSPGYEVNIIQSPLRVFSQQFDLLWRERSGIWPSVVQPYRHGEVALFPADQTAVTVHHADGNDQVRIEACGDDLREYAAVVSESQGVHRSSGVDEATGFSRNLSFDEAFSEALTSLPPAEPTVADNLSRVSVVEVGGLFGGIAGFHHLFVRVARTTD